MRCEHVRRYLPLYLDSELGIEPTAEIARHLEQCGACSERMEGERRLERAFASALSKTAPSDEGAWQRSMVRAVGGRSRTAVWSLAGAAVVVLAAGALVIGLSLREEICLSHAMAANHTKYYRTSVMDAVASGRAASGAQSRRR